MSALRLITAILAYLGLVVIPVCIYTGAFGPLGFLAINGLAGAWVALLLTGICVTAE